MSKVTIVEWEGGDWVSVFLDGEVVDEGHSTSEWAWIEILRKLGVEVEALEVSDLHGLLCGAGLDELRAAAE